MTNEEAINYFERSYTSGDTDDEQQHNEAIGKAIKALEQQPCEDAISREALRQKLQEHRDFIVNTFGGFKNMNYIDKARVDEIDNCIAMVVNAPSVTPQTRWISCSERLPKENEYIGDVCKYYLIQDEYGDMHVAHLSNVGWIPMDSLKAIGDEIMAWRELPQPYTESEDEK